MHRKLPTYIHIYVYIHLPGQIASLRCCREYFMVRPGSIWVSLSSMYLFHALRSQSWLRLLTSTTWQFGGRYLSTQLSGMYLSSCMQSAYYLPHLRLAPAACLAAAGRSYNCCSGLCSILVGLLIGWLAAMVIKPPKELKRHVIVATGLGVPCTQSANLPHACINNIAPALNCLHCAAVHMCCLGCPAHHRRCCLLSHQ